MKFWRQHKDEELDAEIRSHLDEAIHDRIERGESPDEARVNALREFGNVDLVKEVTREMWGWATLKQVVQDLRFGLRMLWKNPGFSLVAIFTLALGIGTNTAIFSVVNGVLLRPLPYPGAERLVNFEGINPDRGISESALSMPDYLDWQSQTDAFESIAAFVEGGMALTGDGAEPERIPRGMVTPSFFQTMGVTPFMGRALLKEDEVADDWVAVLSYGLWQRRFGANPNVVGSWFTFSGGTRCMVVGVMPRGFDYPAKAQIWTLIYPNPKERRDNRYAEVIGRLKPTATIDGAQSQIDTINARLRQQYPETNAGWAVRLKGLQEWTTRDVRTSLLLLLGAIGFVLLIACANIANLLLARASARRKEIALRTALGAGRWRIIRQLLTESLLLAALGGAVGLAFSILLTKLLIAIGPADVPRLDQVGLDARVLGFTVGVAGLVGLLFGLAPALQVSKADLNDVLKEGGRGSSEGHGRNRVRALLVVSEIALSVLLLIGAGLLIKSFVLLRGVNPGFDPENVLTMRVALSDPRYYRDIQLQPTFFRELTSRVSALPGVEAAGATVSLPLGGSHFGVGRAFVREGRPLATEEALQTEYFAVTPDYFKTMRSPVKTGRSFTDRDTAETPKVIVVNESLARRVFAGDDPIGKRITVWPDEKFAREIIGVVGDVKTSTLDKETGYQIYVPYAQDAGWGALSLAVRTKGEPEALTAAVRGAILSIDKNQPAYDIKTMDDVFSASVANTRLVVLLFGVFSMFALLLASIGIYGVIAYSIAQRTHEIGIRLALGAQTRDVRRMIVTQGMILALIGAGLGLAGAFAATRVLRSLLYGVSATDPLIFIDVSLLLTVVALLACYIPARRATKVDPMIALRYE
ncbi:MAG TPA: ABC transporter permease [Pyrinomonadaceae bacterium]